MSRNLLSHHSTQRIICIKFHVLADLKFFVVRWSLVDTLFKSLIVNYLCASYSNGKHNTEDMDEDDNGMSLGEEYELDHQLGIYSDEPR